MTPATLAIINLLKESGQPKRTRSAARTIAWSCDKLGLSRADRFHVFRALEYCDEKGNAFGYGRRGDAKVKQPEVHWEKPS